ncbi:MAG: hypothetical protein G01um1014106_220 [Parcubacteria group bacterium Gr01-1014_106]|nr:MAG: hypothetical protein G01um1014106_220 [Parcubacteria group bacterium Gr01-1014_106]
MLFHRRSMGGRTTPPVWRVGHVEQRRGLSWSFFFTALGLILVASGAGFFYIRQTITTATSGYGISLLERRAEELRKEEAGLQFEVAEFQSLQRIHDHVVKLNLVPVGSSVYTTPVLTTVVTGQIPVGVSRQ